MINIMQFDNNLKIALFVIVNYAEIESVHSEKYLGSKYL